MPVSSIKASLRPDCVALGGDQAPQAAAGAATCGRAGGPAGAPVAAPLAVTACGSILAAASAAAAAGGLVHGRTGRGRAHRAADERQSRETSRRAGPARAGGPRPTPYRKPRREPWREPSSGTSRRADGPKAAAAAPDDRPAAGAAGAEAGPGTVRGKRGPGRVRGDGRVAGGVRDPAAELRPVADGGARLVAVDLSRGVRPGAVGQSHHATPTSRAPVVACKGPVYSGRTRVSATQAAICVREVKPSLLRILST
jgi:hypothetical protein